MKTNEKKLNNCYSINFDESTAQMIETIAAQQQRKPRELLRLLLMPTLESEWIKLQNEQHPENNAPMQQAIFKN